MKKRSPAKPLTYDRYRWQQDCLEFYNGTKARLRYVSISNIWPENDFPLVLNDVRKIGHCAVRQHNILVRQHSKVLKMWVSNRLPMMQRTTFSVLILVCLYTGGEINVTELYDVSIRLWHYGMYNVCLLIMTWNCGHDNYIHAMRSILNIGQLLLYKNAYPLWSRSTGLDVPKLNQPCETRYGARSNGV